MRSKYYVNVFSEWRIKTKTSGKFNLNGAATRLIFANNNYLQEDVVGHGCHRQIVIQRISLFDNEFIHHF
jgi:hypothetical protein